MNKKLLYISSLIIIPSFIVSFIFIRYNKYLELKVNNQYTSSVGKDYGVDTRDQGIKILESSADNDNLIILGSSELSSSVPQNPKNMFPNSQLNCDVSIIGRAYVQSLLDAIKVGALSESFKNKKIVLVVSLQWFISEEIYKKGFQSNFSENQFYAFMNKVNINSETKNYICKRITKLLKNDSAFERSYLYASLNKNNSLLSNTVLKFFKPYYYLRQNYLQLKDTYDSYSTLKQYSDYKLECDIKTINWNEERAAAQKMGEASCTNNQFYAADDYYNTYLKSRIDELKDSNSGINLLNSKEFDDYRIFLEVCKETGIKPYIIFMSTNGFYYDYTGLTKEKRIEFYDKLGEMTNSYGFDYLDLRDKEYEPYFFCDIMHLGWKGWLYVNEKITEYYS